LTAEEWLHGQAPEKPRWPYGMMEWKDVSNIFNEMHHRIEKLEKALAAKD
jgi:hypothetical protein